MKPYKDNIQNIENRGDLKRAGNRTRPGSLFSFNDLRTDKYVPRQNQPNNDPCHCRPHHSRQ